MDFLNNVNFNWKNVLKFGAIALVLVVLAAFAIGIVGATFNNARQSTSSFGGSTSGFMQKAVSDTASLGMPGGVSLSSRNVAPESSNSTIGSDAENFETTDYNVVIETRKLDDTCTVVAGLKSKDYIIFEKAYKYDHGCTYSFKVKKSNAGEVLDAVKGLGAKQISENTQTIKKQIDDFTSQEEILKNKQASIDDTLTNAMKAYDEITALATKTDNAQSLAMVIQSKISIIESLTQQKISNNAQLDQLARSKAEQLDKLEYTFFNVSIYENKFVDIQQLKDSWKAEIKQFVNDVNKIIQGVSVGIVTFLMYIVLYLIYLLIILFVVKFLWQIVKKIWGK